MAIEEIEFNNTDGQIQLVAIDENGNKTPAEVDLGSLDTENLNHIRWADQFEGESSSERIQAAVDDLPEEGEATVIYTEAGELTSTIEITKDNVTLVGTGPTLQVPADASLTTFSVARAGRTIDIDAPIYTDAEGVTLENVNVRGPDADLPDGRYALVLAQQATHLDLEDCNIRNIKYSQRLNDIDGNHSSYCVLLTECENVDITNGRYERASYECIAIGDHNNRVRVENAYIGNGLVHSTQTSRSERIHYDDCTIVNTDGAYQCNGLTMHNGYKNKVTDCTIYSESGYALFVFDGVAETELSNNEVETNRDDSDPAILIGHPNQNNHSGTTNVTVNGGVVGGNLGVRVNEGSEGAHLHGVDLRQADAPLEWLTAGAGTIEDCAGLSPKTVITEAGAAVLPGRTTIEEFGATLGGVELPDAPHVELHIDEVVAATDGEDLQMQFSSDGGSTWDTADGDYRYLLEQPRDDGTDVSETATSAASITLAKDVSNDWNNSRTGVTVTIRDPTADRRAYVEWDGVTAFPPSRPSGAGRHDDAAAGPDAVRFIEGDPTNPSKLSTLTGRVVVEPPA